MTTDVILAGYALPFDAEAIVDGLVESVSPSAFRTSMGRRCDLRWDHHGPVVVDNGRRRLSLWADDFGLAFRASVPADQAWPMANTLRRAGPFGCSVNFADIECDEGLVDGEMRRRITWAVVDHIAITPSPAYAETGIWIADGSPGDSMAPAARALARRWTASWEGRCALWAAVPSNRLAAGARPAAPRALPLSARLAKPASVDRTLALLARHGP